MSSKKARIGDICEIETPKGLFYVQYTHDGPSMGQLVRVLPGHFGTRPNDLASLSRQPEMFFVFYTLNYALREGHTKVVSHQPVPEWATAPPLMRWPGLHDPSGKVVAWKIFRASDAITLEMHQRTQAIRRLSRAQERLSIHQLWPHPVLVRELARGWTPQRAEELRLQDVEGDSARGENQRPKGELSGDTLRYYLYFPQRTSAEKAGEAMRALGLSALIRRGADGESWLTLVGKTLPVATEEIDALQTRLEALARELGGEYDGWEIATNPLATGCVAGDTQVN